MIFERLFLQFQEGKRPCFGSWFMDLHGRWLIGKPKDLMAKEEIRDDVDQMFYYNRPDRHPPQDPTELNVWIRHQLYAAQLREGTAPGHIARAQYPVILLLASALYIAGIGLMGGKAMAVNAWLNVNSIVRVHVGGLDAIQKADPENLLLRDCLVLDKAVMDRQVDRATIPAGTLGKCQGLIQVEEMRKKEEKWNEQQKAALDKGGAQ